MTRTQREILDIVDMAATAFGVRLAEVIDRPRNSQAVTDARHAASRLSRRETGATYETIGRVLGGRDHSTIINSVRKAALYLEIDPQFRSRYEAMERTYLAGSSGDGAATTCELVMPEAGG